jgi:lipopolysaccharide export system permease protein
MRIHDRYVLGLYLRVLFFCVIGFTVVFLLIDVFEKIDSFIDYKASWWDSTRFFLYKVPDMVRLTLPVDVLLATMFTLGVLARNNEVVALLSSGISMLRIARPILLISLLLVGVSAVLSEYVVPITNDRMYTVRRVDIEKRPPLDEPVRHSFSYHSQGGYVVFANRFNTRRKELLGATISFADQGHLTMRLDADRGQYVDGTWVFYDGFVREFADETESARAFHTWKLPELRETPQELARIEREPDAMNYQQLRAYINRLRASGVQVNDYAVDLHAKLSYPFTTLIMALLAVGLTASKKKVSIASSFAQTLFIAFGYLVIVGLTEAFGKNEMLSPAIAGWSAPVFFALASTWFLARVNR